MRTARIICLVVVLAACAETAPTSTIPTSPPATSSTSVPATSTAVPSSTVPTTTPTTTGHAVYLLAEDRIAGGGPFLIPVFRPDEVPDLTAAVASVLRGVTFAESGAGLFTEIPDGTRSLGVDVASGVAMVDLSAEYTSGGGSASMFARLAQVVYTVTRFPGVDAVLFSIDGSPVSVIGGEGILVEDPQTRAMYEDLLPRILIDDPPWGAVVRLPLEVSGVANVFEGSFVYELTAADGVLLDTGLGQAGGGVEVGEFGPFAFTIDIPPAPGEAVLTVYNHSARDGSRENVLEYPVTIAR